MESDIAPFPLHRIMGAPFRIYLGSSRIYSCNGCGTHLAADEDVICRSFHGLIGRAYLFERATNVLRGEPENRSLLSGLYTVADLHCRVCDQVLGWVYIQADRDSQKHKEVRTRGSVSPGQCLY